MKGFSPRNLQYMRTFAGAYPDEQFAQQVVAQLPWGHNVRLLDAVPDPVERDWYALKAIEHGWSTSAAGKEGWNENTHLHTLTHLDTVMTTTVALPDDLHAQVKALAETTGRTVEGVVAEAVAQGLAYDRWFRAEVEEALHSTAAGRFASPEEVEAMWNRLTTPEAMAEAEAELCQE